MTLSDFPTHAEAFAHADLMVTEMRLEVGSAANRPDQEHSNPLRSKYYFVRCLGKRRVVSAEERKTLAASADIKDAKAAAAAAAAMGDAPAAGGSASSGSAAIADSSVKVENEVYAKLRAAVDPLKKAMRDLTSIQLPLDTVRARLSKKAKEDAALQPHLAELDGQMQSVQSFLATARAAVAEALALDRDEPNDELMQSTLDELVDCTRAAAAHTTGIYNTYIHTCIIKQTFICVYVYIYVCMYIYIYIYIYVHTYI
jgi:hypothetical protein